MAKCEKDAWRGIRMQNVKELREDCGLGAVTVKKSPSVKQNANAVPGSPQFILAKQLTYICPN